LEKAAEATRKPAAKRKRVPDEAVFYATAHRIRIEALSMMNDGKTSPNEIAEFLGEKLPAVSHHIRELFDSGCIESAGTIKRRNATEHFYRAVTLPYVTSEEYQAMSPEERREIAALIVQAIMAETLAALRLGKMEGKREPWLTWQAVPIDEEGEQEVAAFMQATYDKADDIKARNANRLAKARAQAQKEGKGSLPTGRTEIVVLMSYERSREGRPDLGYPALSVD
jgi:DNA-binding transcriptional ArsR family regulator